MATLAQIEANRANAKHSTGPVTPEGKARVAGNALKHGLTSRHISLHDDEERAEFAELQAALLEELAPQGALETITFHELLHAAWSMQRFRRIEADFCRLSEKDYLESGGDLSFDRITRYQTRAHRAYYRALKELRTLQTNRALRQQALAEVADPEVPILADIRKTTKQTQSKPAAPARPPKKELQTTGSDNILRTDPPRAA